MLTYDLLAADAAAFIQSGDIALGVSDRGHLIVPGGTPSSNGTTHIGRASCRPTANGSARTATSTKAGAPPT